MNRNQDKFSFSSAQFNQMNWRSAPRLFKVCSLFFLGGMALVLVLSIIGFFSQVSVTVNYGTGWTVFYCLFVVNVIGSGIYCLWYRIKTERREVKSSLSKIIPGALIGAPAALLLFAGAVFSGLPSILHFLTSEPGSLMVTVEAKRDSGSRYQCVPGLVINEFNWFMTDRVCPDQRTFNQSKVGDKLKVHGEVSAYGIQPEAIERLDTGQTFQRWQGI